MDDELVPRLRACVAYELPGLWGSTIVLAASGGADSSALVSMLIEADLIDVRRAVIGHFDHRLRDGAERQRDRDVVTSLGAQFDVEVETGAWHAPRAGESAARNARYNFLGTLARKFGATLVVTGHTADDQAETVVMHAMRGAGPHGLAGMSPVAPLPVAAYPDVGVARPLLSVSRAETRAWCAGRGIQYHDDPTNEDAGLLRNRVRRELLPLMESVAPGARAGLLRVAEEARETVRHLDTATASCRVRRTRDGVVLSRRELRALPETLRAHVYRRALVELCGDARDVGRCHYEALVNATDGAAGSTIMLPRGVRATVDADVLLFTLGEPDVSTIDALFEAPLPFSGVVGDWRMTARHESSARANVVVPPGAVVRGRRPGDRLQPRGMSGHRKLQDYFVDLKVPRRLRDATPLIACGRDVYWTPYGRAGDAPDGVSLAIEASRLAADSHA
ncbi:MAG TPA: tRNA lysidine(34) synthetase TilS [Dehalococcoidia bacterium]